MKKNRKKGYWNKAQHQPQKSKNIPPHCYAVVDVLSKLVPASYPQYKRYVNFDGDLVDMSNAKYWLFVQKGITCVACGIAGKYFVKGRIEFQPQQRTLTLYAVDENGKEVLMTKDHIIPRSRGGKNSLENYQVMCCLCNRAKRNLIYCNV